LAEKNVTQAFEQLLKNNKIKEIEGKYEPLQAVANEYLEHHKKKETLVVVETNAERHHLNKVIRAALIEREEINKNGREYDTHQPQNFELN